eukprot:scaffold1650_cov135-Cylindrotheca_fusiformis.AAC.2
MHCVELAYFGYSSTRLRCRSYMAFFVVPPPLQLEVEGSHNLGWRLPCQPMTMEETSFAAETGNMLASYVLVTFEQKDGSGKVRSGQQFTMGTTVQKFRAGV